MIVGVLQRSYKYIQYSLDLNKQSIDKKVVMLSEEGCVFLNCLSNRNKFFKTNYWKCFSLFWFFIQSWNTHIHKWLGVPYFLQALILICTSQSHLSKPRVIAFYHICEKLSHTNPALAKMMTTGRFWYNVFLKVHNFQSLSLCINQIAQVVSWYEYLSLREMVLP